MTFTVILGVSALLGAVGALWWALSSRPSPARANLFSGLNHAPPAETTEGSLVRQLGRGTRRFVPAALTRKLEVNLVQAGHPSGLDLTQIVGIKVLLAGVSGCLLLLAEQPVWAVIVAVLLFFLPDYWVLSMRDKRQAAMRAKTADTVDQLTICVEAGLGFDAALARVAMSGEGPLSDELRHAISDIQAGVPRAQALRTLADRAQIPEIRQLVSALLQAQKHGVPIAETLRIQSAEMRLKRRQRTEERAAKLTVKMLFPIILCFVPVFMILTAGPAFISIGNVF